MTAMTTNKGDATPDVREALVELVALKDLKDRGFDDGRHYVEQGDQKAKADYDRRKPIAWANARAALATAVPAPQPAEGAPIPELPNGAWQQVPCAVCFEDGHPQRGWLFIPHADGKWVSLCKLPQFSEQVIRYWLAEPNVGG